MKCSNCGGELHYSNGNYICENCGSSFSIDSYYENIDTFICYTENDENGRRVKDSIIAQDLYQKLESKGIKVYYNRVSASDLVGDDLEIASNKALHYAKTVLIIATNKEYFENLYQKYAEQLSGKVVIPIYSDMDAKDIPKGISAIQALNYDNVGSEVDLYKGLMNALGRSYEIPDFNKKSNKKKVKIIVAVCVLLSIAAVSLYLAFGTNLFAKPETPTQPVDQNLAQYNQAMQLVEEEKYADAIAIFSKIIDYKDSKKQMQILYDKYAGYYYDKDKKISFSLILGNGFSSNISLDFLVNETFIKITESATLTGINTPFSFTDSEGNSGNITLIFENDGLKITTKTEKKNSKNVIADQEVFFALKDKSDKKQSTIDKDILINLVKKPTTLKDLNRLGYEYELVYNPTHSAICAQYKIKNTKIILTTLRSDEVEEDAYIITVVAPIKLIAPEKIGKTSEFYFIDNVFVQTNAIPEETYGGHLLPICGEEGEKIKEDSYVVMFSKESFVASDFPAEEYDSIINNWKEGRYKKGFEESQNEDYSEENANSQDVDYSEEYTEYEYEEFDETPNIFCPECGTGYFVTGLGTEGWTCDECGCNWLPCQVCTEENADGIWDGSAFVCNKCGESFE